MIRTRHLFKLTVAKLRTKPTLLLITIAISGLLFTLLFAAIIVSSGFLKSTTAYLDKSNNGNFLVQVAPVIPDKYTQAPNYDLSIDTIKLLRSLEQKYIAAQTQLYKQKGLTFDYPVDEHILQPSPYADASTPEDMRVIMNGNSPVFQLYLQSLTEQYAATAKNTLPDLTSLATNTYHAKSVDKLEYSSLSNASSVWLEGGKEDFSRYNYAWRPKGVDLGPYGYTISSARTSSYSFYPNSLLAQYLLPTNAIRQTQKNTIPVVITQNEAVAMFGKKLGIGDRPNSITEQAAWAKNLATKVNGETYQVCYRNPTELAMLQKYQRDTTDILNHAGDKTYIAPSLQYALPKTPCGDITIAKDTRTNEQKTQDAANITAQKSVGEYTAPKHELLTFSVVGLIPFESTEQTSTGLNISFDQLFGVTNFSGAIIPEGMWDHKTGVDVLPFSANNNTNQYAILEKANIHTAIVAFGDIASARNFMNHETCTNLDTTNCDKLYSSQLLGANYTLLDDLQKLASKILTIAMLAVFVLALIIMQFMMARTIIESRKETAIFRAMGATRSNVFAIYLTYSLVVSAIIALISFATGLLTAAAINLIYAPMIRDYISAIQTSGNSWQFSLIDLTNPLLLYVAVAILIIGVISILLPLIQSVRRSPMKDLSN